jgi:hypothetical protein
MVDDPDGFDRSNLAEGTALEFFDHAPGRCHGRRAHAGESHVTIDPVGADFDPVRPRHSIRCGRGRSSGSPIGSTIAANPLTLWRVSDARPSSAFHL